MEKDRNSVVFSGKIVEDPKYSHTTQGIPHYTMMVRFLRKSGTSDILPVCFTEEVFNPNGEYEGQFIELSGSFRSHSKTYGNKNHLIHYIYADYMNIVEIGNENAVTIEGCVCKEPYFKERKSGYVLTDFLVASNRINGKTDYIPCIAWMEQAREARKLEIGDRVRINGRLQSRIYKKTLEDGGTSVNTVYEVSITSFEKVEKGEENESDSENTTA